MLEMYWPPQNWAAVYAIPSTTVIFCAATSAILTAGFKSPPLWWPITIARVAMLRPAVNEMRRTVQVPSCQLSVEPHTKNTKIVVAANSPPTQTQNSRFRSRMSMSSIGIMKNKTRFWDSSNSALFVYKHLKNLSKHFLLFPFKTNIQVLNW